MKKIILVLITVFCILNLSTCFSPWEGDGEGSLTVHIGSSARSALFYDTDENIDGFTHSISIRDNEGNLIIESRRFSGRSTTISAIKSGRSYTVSIKGFDDTLRSYGREPVLLKPGNNTVTVPMYSAVEVNGWDDFSDALGEAEGEVSGRRLYVFINNTIPVPIGQHDFAPKANVILIPEKADKMFDVGGGTLTLGTSNMTGTISINVTDGAHSLGTVSNNGKIALNVGSSREKFVPLIEVSGGSLTLGEANMDEDTITLTGHDSVINQTSLLRVSGGELVMNDGVTITGNKNGGGVRVRDGIFSMNGGTISSNSAEYGGGVGVWNGTFNMNGGTIEGNGATKSGGGVAVDMAIFNMTGGKISDNTADGGGGGVQVWPDGSGNGTFTMSGNAEIYNNEAANGGGVQVGGSRGGKGIFDMIGGKIHDNTAEGSGGVSVGSNGTFIMIGGEIHDNTAKGSGGVGVGVGGTFFMNGGEIFKNISTEYGGGGVKVWPYGNGSGRFEMSDGKIYDNKANYGGGVEVGGENGGEGTFIMKGNAEIYDNKANGGGGVNVTGISNSGGKGIFLMNGGTIGIEDFPNIAINGDGGGVGVSLDGTFTMSAGKISYNTANNGGGVGVWNGGEFTMSGGTISNNEAIYTDENTGYGGGVNIWDGIFEKNGGIIYGIGDNNDNNNNKADTAISAGRDGLSLVSRNSTAGANISMSFNRTKNSFDGWDWDHGFYIEVPVSSNQNAYNGYAGLSNLTSSIGYDIINFEGEKRYNVMKVVKPDGDDDWAVALYSLSDYKNRRIKITFSVDVKRIGEAGDLNWQINNKPNYPTVGAKWEAQENIWYTISGTWTGTLASDNNDPWFYLSAWQNNSPYTTYYIHNFKVTVTRQ